MNKYKKKYITYIYLEIHLYRWTEIFFNDNVSSHIITEEY